MMNNGKRWMGAALVGTMLTFAGGTAHGQYIQGDLWQYQRDQRQIRRDYYQLNRDAAVGNLWGIQRDIANLQRDQQDLAIDRQNLQGDMRLNTLPYPPITGTYPTPPCSRGPVFWNGSPYPAGAAQFPVNRPW